MRPAARIDELAEGVPKVVRVEGRDLVLVRWRERVFALRNVCPHESQSFTGGVARGRYCGTGVPGELRVDDSRPVLVCPWHTWEYELESGSSTTDSRFRVRSYPVSVVAGEVFVEVAVGRERLSAPGPDQES